MSVQFSMSLVVGVFALVFASKAIVAEDLVLAVPDTHSARLLWGDEGIIDVYPFVADFNKNSEIVRLRLPEMKKNQYGQWDIRWSDLEKNPLTEAKLLASSLGLTASNH